MTIELQSGAKTLRFREDEFGRVTPDWFLQNDAPVLRFKKHEWTSVGHKRVTALRKVSVSTTRADFAGEMAYGEATVAVKVTVDVDPLGFWVEVALTPDREIELLEAGASFDLPFVYDGTESVTTIIGGQPVVKWDADREITPPGWKDPQWGYNAPESARCTRSCWNPMVSLEVRDGKHDRRVGLVGDWHHSHFKEIFTTPSLYRLDETGKRLPLGIKEGLRNYKLLCGALNWASSIRKDPNVCVQAGETLRQRVLVTWEEDLARPVDDWLFSLWSKALSLTLPDDGVIPVGNVYRALNMDYPTMAAGLQRILRKTEDPTIWHEERGIAVYALGTRPKEDNGDNLYNMMWAGDSYQYARIRGEETDRKRALELIGRFWPRLMALRPGVERVPFDIFHLTNLLACPGAELSPLLQEGLFDYLDAYRSCYPDNAGKLAEMDLGNEVAFGRLLAHGGSFLGNSALRDHGRKIMIAGIRELSARYWHCAMNEDGGGNIRPPALAAASFAALDLYMETGETVYRDQMIRFLRLVLSINFHSYDGIGHPDLDARGWCNGANGGRDQMCEIPPWETSVPLRALAAALPHWKNAPEAAWQILHLAATTTMAQVPAARTHRLAYTLDGGRELRNVGTAPDRFSAAKNFYHPWLAYENPYDQTMAAGYQSAEIWENALTFGGGWIGGDHAAVTVVVPDAATGRLDPTRPTLVALFNAATHENDVTLSQTGVTDWCLTPANEAPLTPDADGRIRITLPPRRAIWVTASPKPF